MDRKQTTSLDRIGRSDGRCVGFPRCGETIHQGVSPSGDECNVSDTEPIRTGSSRTESSPQHIIYDSVQKCERPQPDGIPGETDVPIQIKEFHEGIRRCDEPSVRLPDRRSHSQGKRSPETEDEHLVGDAPHSLRHRKSVNFDHGDVIFYISDSDDAQDTRTIDSGDMRSILNRQLRETSRISKKIS